ncbi:C47 family peptidase [Vallitalea guaymasensis]|uniref:C39 family peptidase n=1 Tax=Vallitalea guaymasensis TaxID=1185412 RepID=A0A8J8M8A5_9FIRM|nr:C47 family peptidase [Vallitalea guaymasensis]QUH28124.1 C39 family peptidase [Vallitalea guaymasensis]
MKKILSLLLAACLVISTTIVSNASDLGVYLLTKECPQNIHNYVNNNINNFLNSKSNEGEISLEDITIGQVFSIEKENVSDLDVFYFPVFQKGHLKYTFRVYEVDGNITGILSPYLVKELLSVSGKTTTNSPARLAMNNGNVVTVINDKITTIKKDPLGRRVNNYSINNENYSNITVNINEKNDKNIIKGLHTSKRQLFSLDSVSSNNLSLDLAETQGQQSWCSAFAGAAIIRYKTHTNVFAKDIMKYYHPNSEKLEDEYITNYQLIRYAQRKGLYPRRRSYTLSLSSVVSQIDNSQPMYIGCQGRGDYEGARHALVLRGYDKTNNTYSIWNPWYKYYETMPMDTKVYTVDPSASFKWDTTIYDWSKL